MHSCPKCDQACDCDNEDTWWDDFDGCTHICVEVFVEEDDDMPYYDDDEEDANVNAGVVDREPERLGFGYWPDIGWAPAADQVKFLLYEVEVVHLDGRPNTKSWILEHNLDYYDLVFQAGLGMKAEDVTGEMVVKACLAASWDDACIFFATTFAKLVESGSQAEADDESDEDEE